MQEIKTLDLLYEVYEILNQTSFRSRFTLGGCFNLELMLSKTGRSVVDFNRVTKDLDFEYIGEPLTQLDLDLFVDELTNLIEGTDFDKVYYTQTKGGNYKLKFHLRKLKHTQNRVVNVDLVLVGERDYYLGLEKSVWFAFLEKLILSTEVYGKRFKDNIDVMIYVYAAIPDRTGRFLTRGEYLDLISEFDLFTIEDFKVELEKWYAFMCGFDLSFLTRVSDKELFVDWLTFVIGLGNSDLPLDSVYYGGRWLTWQEYQWI